MQIVFMNRLIKGSDNDDASAQVWIGEEEGVWHLGWRNLWMDGQTEDVSWYEGISWQELICIYRHNLAMKLGEGYQPLIEGIFHDNDSVHMRGQSVQMLYCYSELHSKEEVFVELCAWRRRRAHAERKAPYLIASNKLLRLISAYLPHHVDELIQLPGVGQNKVSDYGADLLEITAKVERHHTFPLNWVYGQLNEEAYRAWLYKQKEQKYKQELHQFKLQRVILEGISEGKNIEQLLRECESTRKEIIEVLEQLEKDGYNTEPLIESELQAISHAEQEAIWTAFRELGDSLLKPILLKVYGEEKDADSLKNIDMLYEGIRFIRIQFRRNKSLERSVS
ncbi:HRDC domain-containing protein [Paenibacillus sp. CMAA1364]